MAETGQNPTFPGGVNPTPNGRGSFLGFVVDDDVLGVTDAIALTVGGIEIEINDGGINGAYGEDRIISLETDVALFKSNAPTIGSFVSRSLETEVLGEIAAPRQGKVIPYAMVNGAVIQKGEFYIDTRKPKKNTSGTVSTQITAYDCALKSEVDYPASTLQWPALDTDVLHEITNFCGIEVAASTEEAMCHGFMIPYTTGYTCREILGFIAGLYGGNFYMNDNGQMELVTL